MITTEQVQSMIGQTMYGDGEKIGKIEQVFLDDQTGQPEWATTTTGLFGTGESFVPLAEASLSADGVTVPYSKDTIKAAPRMEPDQGHLSQAEEAELYRYYGLEYGESQSDSGLAVDERHDRPGEAGHEGYDVSGPTTDDAMTRSEERLRVGTEKRESGRARLRKYVVSEDVTQSVPVTRERARVEREPITEANRDAAMAGGDLTDEEHEVILHQERAVVDKETVPVERVRLGKETVTDEEQVSEEVRKERIEAEGTDSSDQPLR